MGGGGCRCAFSRSSEGTAAPATHESAPTRQRPPPTRGCAGGPGRALRRQARALTAWERSSSTLALRWSAGLVTIMVAAAACRPSLQCSRKALSATRTAHLKAEKFNSSPLDQLLERVNRLVKTNCIIQKGTFASN